MHRNGHIGAALLTYSPLGAIIALVGLPQVAIAGLLGVAGLAMVPDQDQRVPGLTHRGITHTVWFALLVGVVLALAAGYVASTVGDGGLAVTTGIGLLGFVVGVISVGSHILADALTPMGVTPFIPVDERHYTLDVATASNPVANYALLAGGGVAASVVVLIAGVV